MGKKTKTKKKSESLSISELFHPTTKVGMMSRFVMYCHLMASGEKTHVEVYELLNSDKSAFVIYGVFNNIFSEIVTNEEYVENGNNFSDIIDNLEVYYEDFFANTTRDINTIKVAPGRSKRGVVLFRFISGCVQICANIVSVKKEQLELYLLAMLDDPTIKLTDNVIENIKSVLDVPTSFPPLAKV